MLLSAFSKPSAVTLPLALLLIDYWKERSLNRYLWLEKLPFLCISILFGLMAISVKVVYKKAEILGLIDFNNWEVILLSGQAFVFYLLHVVYPENLVNYYPYPEDVSIIGSIVSMAIIASIAGIVFYYKKHRMLVFGFVFFCINLVLVLPIIRLGNSIIADRYTYLPYLGMFIIMGWVADLMINKFSDHKKQYKYLTFILLGSFAFYIMKSTTDQVKVWKNSETLWTQTIAVYPNNYFAYGNRAAHYKWQDRISLAMKDVNRAIDLNSNAHLSYNLRANIYFSQNKIEEAIRDYNKAIELYPERAEYVANRASAYARGGKQKEALIDFDAALKLDPEYYQVHKTRGVLYNEMGNYKDDIQELEIFLSYEPYHHGIRNDKAIAHQHLSQHILAIEELSKAINIQPSNAIYHLHRSYSFFYQNDLNNAINDAKIAQQLGLKVDANYLARLGIKMQ